MFINWTDKAVVVVHGLIGTQHIWAFWKILSFRWLNERPLGIAHMLLLTVQYKVLTAQYRLAVWLRVQHCWLELVYIWLVYFEFTMDHSCCFQNYHFASYIVNYHWNNIVFYRKWWNLKANWHVWQFIIYYTLYTHYTGCVYYTCFTAYIILIL